MGALRPLVALTGLAALAVLTAAAPLLVYSVTLATLGLAHVAVELRYVEARFGPRLSRALVVGLVVLLAAVVVLRGLRIAGALGADGVPIELGIVATLVGLVTAEVGLRAGLGLAALGLAALVALGAALAPVPTILLLGVLHNWTPLGFVAEATSGPDRRRWLGWGVVAFGVFPAVIASGALQALTASWGWQEASVLPTGPLAAQLGAYLPRGLHGETWAVPVFSAVAFAQCMHYAAVLGVLPRFAPAHPTGPLTALSWPVYLALVGLGTLVLLAGYAGDFGAARQLYGVVAAVHAWVELPLLLLALRPAAA